MIPQVWFHAQEGPPELLIHRIRIPTGKNIMGIRRTHGNNWQLLGHENCRSLFLFVSTDIAWCYILVLNFLWFHFMIQSHLILFTLPIFWHFFIHPFPFPYPFSFFHLHFFSPLFFITRRISSSIFLKRLRKNRRHTNCDPWKVSACPFLTKGSFAFNSYQTKVARFLHNVPQWSHHSFNFGDDDDEKKIAKVDLGKSKTPLGDRKGDTHHLDVSKNRGTPKWMVYNGKPY